MVSRVRIPKGRRRPSGKKDAEDKARRKILEQFIRGIRQKPGGTKPKPKAVPKGTKTGPAVKGKMSTRPKKPDYLTRPKPKRPSRPITGPTPKTRPPNLPTKPDKGMQGLLEQRPKKKRKPIDPKALPGGGTTVNPGTRPKRPVGRKPSKRPTPSRPTRDPIRPKPKRPTRKPPTRRPSRRPRGMMDAIRRGMRGIRKGSQR
mgnify:FL=1|jgi:hypothetical protein